jgi:predicted Zn-dependent protease
VVSTGRLPARGVSEASIEAWRRRLARESIHFVGHLWDLHHCYDARCSMHPSWSPLLAAAPEADLCTFCREKSERKVRLAKT